MAVEYALTVNGVLLEGRPTNPASCYLIQTVEGMDSRELREDVNPSAGRHGDVTGGQLRAGLRLIVTGYIIAATLADLRTKERAIRAALAGGASFPVTLAGRAGDPAGLTETFWVSAPLRAGDDVDGPRLLKPFTFSVRSDSDAWRRTTPASTSSASTAADATVTVTNVGDIPVRPTFTLTATGSATLDYIENTVTGDRLDVTIPVTAGTVMTFNCQDMTVKDATGVSWITSVTAASKWLQMPTGPSSFRFHLSSGTLVTMVVSWADRYL